MQTVYTTVELKKCLYLGRVYSIKLDVAPGNIHRKNWRSIVGVIGVKQELLAVYDVDFFKFFYVVNSIT